MMKRHSLTPSTKISLTKCNKKCPSLMLNDSKVQLATIQEHLVLILDSRLNFIKHIDNKVNKCNKVIGLM